MGNMINTLIFFVYLVFGIYFINIPFNLIPMLPNFGEWVIFVGGVLIIFGGIKYLRVTRFVPRAI